MARPQHLPLSFTRPGGANGDSRCSVVWLNGEHDSSTKLALASVIKLVADLDRRDVVVDLSGVTFMDASIVGTLIAAQKQLRVTGLALGVRAPSACARALLGLCHLEDLVWVAADADHPSGMAAALGTWVEVPRHATNAATKVASPVRMAAVSVVRELS